MHQRERTGAAGGLATLAPAATAPDLSVCVVNWNCRDVLRDCLRSLERQACGLRFEVIVIDNASSDGAADMVAREFPHVRLVRNVGNVGFARANNQAFQLARGKHLFFLNNDTVVPPGALRRLADFLDAHPDVVILGPRLRDVRGRPQTSYRRRPTPATFLHRTLVFRMLGLGRGSYRRYRRQAFADRRPRDVEVLMGAAVAIPRTALQQLGGWDEDFAFGGEDMELCHRARRLGRVVYWPEVEVTHLGSVSTKRHVGFASTQIAIGFARYFRKTGASRLSLFGYKLAVTLDAPVRLVTRSVQYAWRRFRGRRRRAEKCLREIRGAAAFLGRGLLAFWRA
jgi:GT2 family glycosyltransferase